MLVNISRNKIKKNFNFNLFSELELVFMHISTMSLILVVWAGFLAFIDIPFNFINIAKLHFSVVVWVVDILILSIPLAIVYNRSSRKNYAKKLEIELDELKKKISSNIEVATLIGEGKLEDFVVGDDQMAQALLQMGQNLKENKLQEEALQWITKGKEILNDTLRVHTNLIDLSSAVIKLIVNYSNAVQGSIFLLENDSTLRNVSTFAFNRYRFINQEIPLGKGLVGQVAYEKLMIYRTEIPLDYFSITSGLIGDRTPKSLIIIPLLQEEKLQGVLELGFLEEKLPNFKLLFAEELSKMIGRTIFNLKVSQRTEMLLKESQEMTQAMRVNEDKLHQNAIEMLASKEQLEKSNTLLENQFTEVENGRKRLHALLTNASEFISIYDSEKDLVYESPSVKRILGYEDGDNVIGMDPDLLTPRGLRTINSLFQYLLDTPGGEMSAQYNYLKKSGEKIFLETKGKNLLHDSAIRGIILNTQDITERKRAEKEERMKSRMQSLSENSPDMIIRVNPLGRLVYFNPALATFIGVDSADLAKRRIFELELGELFTQFVEQALNSIKENNQQVVSEIEVNSGEGLRIMEVKAIPELGDDKELETILFVAHDVTELKIIEQEIKEKNKKISDSINYAQRIQTAILPDTRYIQQFFPRSFIFYRPKDIVSGDFPWFFVKDDIYYVAAVDCTGHGVPGALLSFIGYFLLNNIVNTDKNGTAAEILDTLHQWVRTTLKQDQEGANGRDGMDLALCKIDPKKNEIQYSGAHRPLYYLRDGELIEYAGTRKGIGGIPLAKKIEKDFENHVINYQKGDKFFIFSDGLPDQMGGPDCKKYQAKRIREALTDSKELTMAHFTRYFSQDFFEWMGNEKQVDDVLLIGIEL